MSDLKLDSGHWLLKNPCILDFIFLLQLHDSLENNGLAPFFILIFLISISKTSRLLTGIVLEYEVLLILPYLQLLSRESS